jgi:two-component system, OmpR family, phosphate regulon sensor histidine kinase PhoR
MAEAIRILVVDDELGMREGCRRILAAEGFEVEVAEDGQRGLAAWQARRDFAAAIVDLKMPRMGGLELIEAIRAQDEDIVLFVVTAYAAIDTAVEATKRGATSYIPKPFTPDELLLPVRNGLEKRALALEAKRLRQERERRLLEVAVERSRSNTIINCMTDAVLVVNRERQLVLRNATATRVLPGARELGLPAPLSALGCPELVGLVEDCLRTGAGPSISSREVPLGACTYLVNASPVLEPNGDASGAVAVLRDITALKKLSRAKSMFVSMVAHEVKSPLAAIEGYLNVILSGVAGQDAERDHKMLERCVVRARTLRTMVTELLSLTAMETGNFSIRREQVDLSSLAREVVEAYRDRAAEKHIELTFEAQSAGGGGQAPGGVLADREAMRSAFGNLVDNALKYTPEGGHVGVRVQADLLYFRFSVRDDGVGISEAEQPRLFEEFFRAKNRLTACVPGTGLGLSLVKRLVDLHQGTLQVQSAPGQGSEFSIRLPASE